jgi:hypothetical protein
MEDDRAVVRLEHPAAYGVDPYPINAEAAVSPGVIRTASSFGGNSLIASVSLP